MTPVLTLFTIAIISTLFFGSVPAEFQQPMQIAAIALPSLQLILQMLNLGRRNTESTVSEDPAQRQPEQPAAAIVATTSDETDAAVVQFLARLQEKGRLVDFIMDDIAAYDNESVGAAARIVHQGCHEVLHDCFTIEAIHEGEEMEPVSLADTYDSTAYRLIGKVPDSAPFNGLVLHRGWKTTQVKLPQLASAADNPALRTVIAPAEVEIS
ncbi:MAG: DUF2760 domain-containing protein [Desulfuromonas sp.]|nr:DUF2760 domain-containing protein [Desulfuromonas sp.]